MKNKEKKIKQKRSNSLQKLFFSSKKFIPYILISSIFAITSSVIAIIAPNKLSDLVNVISDGLTKESIDVNAFQLIAYQLLAFYITVFFCSFIQQFIMANVTQKMSYKLRSDINIKISKLPLSFYDKNTVGDILSRITNDVDTISQTFGSAIASLFEAFVMFIGVLIMMFVTNYILAFITIGTSIIGFTGIFIIMHNSEKYFKRRQENLGQMNGRIQEDFSNQKVIKAYLATDYSKDKFSKINKQLYINNQRSQFLVGMMMPMMNFTGNLSYACVFMFGVILSINNPALGLTFGTIVSFTIYARLFSQPLQTFAQSFSSLQQASAASDRVVSILEEKEMEDESEKNYVPEKVIGNVKFDHVKFSYTSEREIIKDFSANLKAGMKVAIVGPTGAGKTTMVNLLMRFYEVNSGNIYLDGHSLQEMKRETVHSLFDMILQDTWLFSGTIKENLVFNKEGVKDEELDKACEAVGLSYYIKSLPNGYDTLIDPTSLSEGQKQQITIARALIKDSPLLILDEATSSVDTRTEIKIQEAMDNMTKGRTSFVIAHRLSTIKNADIILVMKDGDIIEQGNHEQLLALNGFYASLYNSQFETV